MADERQDQDRWLWGAVLAGLVVRIVPFLLWLDTGCVRDECTYRKLAYDIVAGKGLTTGTAGWLWAPGYPAILALSIRLGGSEQSVKALQIAAAVVAIVLAYAIGERVAGRATARWAAFLVALHPTLAFFATRMWSEQFYVTALLGAVWGLLWARDGGWRRAILPGVLVGVCVLFRGVATYMAPIFAVAAVWPSTVSGPRLGPPGPAGETLADAVRARWKHAVAAVVATIVTVAPYSVYATQTYGGFVVSDATLGQMMWLGDNDFSPVTFDQGDGLVEKRAYDLWTKRGRPHCDDSLPPARWDKCEVHNGVAWIEAHPAEFVGRIPLRLAQLLDPHTFLTRHVRAGRWVALPWEIEEPLMLFVVLTSLVVTLGGTAAAWLRARGPFAVLSCGIVAYHVAAVAMLAGLSRYRLPLEPLWMIWLAAVAASPRDAWTLARSQPWRIAGAVVSVVVLLPLCLWFLPDGFPGFGLSRAAP